MDRRSRRPRKPVNLRGEDEVVLRQAADRVRPDLHGHMTKPFEMQIGMMPFGLSNGADAIEELQGDGEILGAPFPPNSFAIGRQRPIGELRQERIDPRSVEGRHACFAGKAVFLSKLLVVGCRHSTEDTPVDRESQPRPGQAGKAGKLGNSMPDRK
jgi:hypothetical protein